MGRAVEFTGGEILIVLRCVEYTFLYGIGETFLHGLAHAFGLLESFGSTGSEIIMDVEGLLDSFEEVLQGEFVFLEHLDQGVDDLEGFHGVVTVKDDLLEFLFVFLLEVWTVKIYRLKPDDPVLLKVVELSELI